ncbi:hypothetical protein RJ55_05361 [Drechmeria coniospora]|nr:hypothetical protein RJ55_05361 [Drechmeria coniospora]
MRSVSFIAVLAALAQASCALKVDIRADTNRDGKVDTEGVTDVPGKHRWTDSLGALFLANIGDTNRRCGQMEGMQGNETVVSDETLMACHDAADDLQRAPQYLAPMRTMPLMNLSPSAFGSVSVVEEQSRTLVRVFRRVGGQEGWRIVKNDTVLAAEELANGLELGIDARDVRRPGWDGKATVQFSVTDGGQTSSDAVALRVAPLFTHHHLQKVETVLASDMSGERAYMNASEKAEASATIREIAKIVKAAGIDRPLRQLHTPDLWTEDYFEPTFMSIPGPEGPVVLRIMVSTSDEHRSYLTHRLPFQQLRDTGIGAVHYHPGDISNQNYMEAFGNLETIPPYEAPGTGKKYPMGRIIAGGAMSDRPPTGYDIFRAQGVQDPLLVDSQWLLVQHVDEFLQFLPANTTRGWSIMINDPDAGMQLVRDAQQAGLGATPFINYKNRSLVTANDLLDGPHRHANANASHRIQATIDLLKHETGITDQEIFRVPAVYEWADAACHQQRRRQVGDSATHGRHLAQKRRECKYPGMMSSISPAVVNGLVLSRSRYIAPKPWGPMVNGTDIFESATRNSYQRAGFDVDFVDDWQYHQRDGDVHCGTNTLRDASAEWWKR